MFRTDLWPSGVPVNSSCSFHYLVLYPTNTFPEQMHSEDSCDILHTSVLLTTQQEGLWRPLRWPPASWAKNDRARGYQWSPRAQVIRRAYKEAFKRVQDPCRRPAILKWTERTASTLSLENLNALTNIMFRTRTPATRAGGLSCSDWLLWGLQVGNVLQVIREVLLIWLQPLKRDFIIIMQSNSGFLPIKSVFFYLLFFLSIL